MSSTEAFIEWTARPQCEFVTGRKYSVPWHEGKGFESRSQRRHGFPIRRAATMGPATQREAPAVTGGLEATQGQAAETGKDGER